MLRKSPLGEPKSAGCVPVSKLMPAKYLLPILALGALSAASFARLDALLAPVLPEVNKHLQEGQADIASNTMPMAKAHAQVVLLGKDLSVGVLFQNIPAAEHQHCLDALDSAMQEWNSVLGGTVNFTRANTGDFTNITVRFRPKVVMKGEDVAGYVNWKRSIKTPTTGDPKGIFYADLQIREKQLDGSLMPLPAMRHAAMHELGHVLGLDDSSHVGDVMGPLDVENPVASPSDLEIATVKSLREKAQEIIDQADAPAKK